jgi:hypothetical protein
VRRTWPGGDVALIALLTGFFLAVSWWPIIFSRLGLRPILEPVLLVGAALFWWRKPWLAGFFLGLSTYSYTAARITLLIPAFLLVYLFLFRKRLPAGQEKIRGVLIILMVSWLVYLPLELTLRADPTLQERIRQLSGPLDALREGDFGPIWQTTTATLGVFTFAGDPLSSYVLPEMPLFGLVMGLLFYGGLLLILRRLGRHPHYGLLLIWLGVTLIPSAAAADAPSLIRLIGAMPVIYLLPAVALAWLYRLLLQADWARKEIAGRFPVSAIVSALMAALLLVVNLSPTLNNGFGKWLELPDTRQKYQSIWLDISRHWREEGQQEARSLVVADSWYEPVKADSLRRDYGHQLPDRWVQQGRAVVFPAEQPALYYVPEFAAPHPFLAELAGLEQPLYRSEVFPSFAVYRLSSDAAFTGDGRQEPVSFRPPESAETALTLLGWQTKWVSETAELQLVTWWQVNTLLPWDTTLFAHLLNNQFQPASQHDTFDAAPLTLRPGDHFLQLQIIQAAGLEESYRLTLGLYHLQSQARWQRTDGDPADHLVLITDWQPGTQP